MKDPARIDPPGHGRALARAKIASEDFDRLLTVLDERRRAMWDSMSGWPGAAHYDSNGGHEVNGVSDPTGDVAAQYDPAHRDLRTTDELISRISREVRLLFYLCAKYEPRRPTPKDQRDSSNTPGCESCVRLEGKWSLPRQSRKLDNRMWLLCAFCLGWYDHHGALPSRDALTAHHQGKHPRLRAV